MRTIETKVYKFNELSDTAKENAIDRLRNINVDYDWWEDDFLLDIVSPKKISKKIDEILANEGCVMFNWERVYFSLDRNRYIQFVNLEVDDRYIDLFRQFLGIPKSLWKNVYYEFSNENNINYYRYEPNTYIVFEHQENKDFTEKQWNILEKAQKKFDDLVFNAWQQLASQYDYLISDESIIETIECNDYEFTEEGKLI